MRRLSVLSFALRGLAIAGLVFAMSGPDARGQSRLRPCPSDQNAYWDNCVGTQTLQTGTYAGEFHNNKRNGRFTVTYKDGHTFVGQFRDDLKNGSGTETFANGNKYVGEYRDGKRNGQFTVSYPDGASFVGQFWNDEKNGPGTETFANGNKYAGQYQDGKRSGTFTVTYADGATFVGQFGNDHRNGQGTLTLANGNRYVGQFKDDEFDGQGTYTYPDGRKYAGEYRGGKRNGTGTFYAANGTVQSGIWQDGTLTQPTEVAPSGTGGTAERRVALIIANANYALYAPLANPRNDANLIASALRASGFQSVTVKNDLTREQMLIAIQQFAAASDNADWSVVYYSGHGIAYNGSNYMIPVDARLKADRDIDIEAIDAAKVSNAMGGAKKLRLVILDMCRSNPFVKSMTRTIASRAVGRGLVPPVETEAGEYTAFAARDGQEAMDGEGSNSPFAEALARRLQMPNVDVRRVFDYVRDDVLKTTSRQQQPFTYGSLPPVDFFFVRK